MFFFQAFYTSLFDQKSEFLIAETSVSAPVTGSDFLREIARRFHVITESAIDSEITIPGRACVDTIEWTLAAVAAGKIINLVDEKSQVEWVLKLTDARSEQAADIAALSHAFLKNAPMSKFKIQTSGSTGSPSVVTLGFAEFCYQIVVVSHELGLSSNDRQLLYMPLNYVYGLSVCLTSIYSRSVLVETSYRIDEPNSFFDQIVSRDITCFSGVPFTYQLLVRKWGLQSIKQCDLRIFTQAGGLLADDLKSDIVSAVPSVAFWVMYGQTEMGGRISQFKVNDAYDHRRSVGRPLEGVEIYIDRESNEDVDLKEGEIFVSSPSRALNAADLLDSKNVDGKVFLATGDIGYMQSGFLYVVGRNKNFVKVAGRRINLTSVEAYIRTLPCVVEVVCELDETRFPILLTGISVSEDLGAVKSQSDLREALDKLGDFTSGVKSLVGNVPHLAYLFEGELATLSSGKIDVKLLKRRLCEQYKSKGAVHIRM